MAKQFKEIKQLSYPKTEVEILGWWKENNIFQKSLDSRVDGIPFTFLKAHQPQMENLGYIMFFQER